MPLPASSTGYMQQYTMHKVHIFNLILNPTHQIPQKGVIAFYLHVPLVAAFPFLGGGASTGEMHSGNKCLGLREYAPCYFCGRGTLLFSERLCTKHMTPMRHTRDPAICRPIPRRKVCNDQTDNGSVHLKICAGTIPGTAYTPTNFSFLFLFLGYPLQTEVQNWLSAPS